MPIERPDWSPTTAVVATAAPSVVTEGGESRDLRVAGPLSADLAVAAPSSTDIEVASGLPGDVIRDMTNTVEGFGPQLSMLQDSAAHVLSSFKDPEAFAAHFDTLSPAVQSVVYRVLLKNPGIHLHALAAKVESLFTLEQKYEAEQWIQKWNAR